MIQVATVLGNRAQLARRSLPTGPAEWAAIDLTIDQRIASCDPAGFHDALVEAISLLDAARDELERLVVGPAMRGSLARLAAMTDKEV